MATIPYKYESPKAVLSSPAQVADIYEKVKVAGGYNPATNTFKPLDLSKVDIAHGSGQDWPIVPGYVLYATLTAAVEAGIADAEMWPTQLFATADSYGKFVRSLRDYEECYKLIDPWWCAFRALLGQPHEEEGFSTAADLSKRFIEVLNELPEQWS